MQRRQNISFSPQMCILLAASALIIPYKWLIAWLAAATFHELCHYTTIKAMKIGVDGIFVGAAGTIIRTGPINDSQEIICVLAGPIGSLLLTAVSSFFPRLALCGLFQATFNLLPIYPLDGGRALYCTLRILTGERVANTVRVLLSAVLALGIMLLTLYYKIGVFCVFILAILAVKRFGAKLPCKHGQTIVQ